MEIKTDFAINASVSGSLDETKEEGLEGVVAALQAHCANTGKKFESLPKVVDFVFAMGMNMESYKRQIMQTHKMTMSEFFVHMGVLSTPKMRFEEMMDRLAEKYQAEGRKVTTFGQLEKENPEMEIGTIHNSARIYCGLTARALLIQRGIMFSDEELKQKDAPAAQPKDPAEIPENIQRRMENLFAKLDSAYPDKVIVYLNRDHKTWGETITQLYRALGYGDSKSFLEAYGYVVNTEDKGGRPKKDPMEIINELKRRYPDGSGFTSVDELKAANPDLSSRFQSLRNRANEYFGMPFAQYLRSIGLLAIAESTAQEKPKAKKQSAPRKRRQKPENRQTEKAAEQKAAADAEAERKRKAAEEAAEAERKRQEEEAELKRQEEAERRRIEEEEHLRALQAAEKAAEEASKALEAKRSRYFELTKAIQQQKRIIAQNKGWLGAQAKARKAAQEQLGVLQSQLAEEFPNGRP